MNFKTYFNIISEGGNVFSDSASIKKEHIPPTLDAYFKELKRLFPKKNIFSEKYFKSLGSVGKKDISGDIDLGIDVKNLLDKTFSDKSIEAWNINPEIVKERVQILSKRAKTASPKQLMIKAFLMELAKYINENSNELIIDEKKVKPGNIFGLYPQKNEAGEDLGINVQLDWMVGNIDWLTFSFFSDVYEKDSNIKGLHNTQLLLSTFVRAGYIFNHTSGVRDKETGEVIATNPKEALEVLSDKYNISFTKENTRNYFKLHDLLKTLPKEDYSAIIDTYLKILDSTKADIPLDLQDEWRTRKAKLGLQGKFLPDTSNLKGI